MAHQFGTRHIVNAELQAVHQLGERSIRGADRRASRLSPASLASRSVILIVFPAWSTPASSQTGALPDFGAPS